MQDNRSLATLGASDRKTLLWPLPGDTRTRNINWETSYVTKKKWTEEAFWIDSEMFWKRKGSVASIQSMQISSIDFQDLNEDWIVDSRDIRKAYHQFQNVISLV